MGVFQIPNTSALLALQGNAAARANQEAEDAIRAFKAASEARSVTSPIDPVLEATDVITGLSITPTPPPLGATKQMRTYRIISNNARTMLGTIYLPAGRLVIDADKPVGDQSAYTVVVAQQVNLYEGPNLYLNANYDATSVPVPKGVGPVTGRLLLTQ